MTNTTHEAKVRRFYDDGGEGAGTLYTNLIGEVWHHGDRAARKAGKTVPEAALIIERRLMDLAGLRPGQRALDFGSGPGGATTQMAEMTGATFVGLSNTESLSQRARDLAADKGLDGQVFFMTVGDRDYRTLGAWPDGSFDAVTFFESVCHLSDQQAFFNAAFRVLKPGGRLVGLEWLQRPFGAFQAAEQIQSIIDPVCQHIRLSGLGTLDSYAAMMHTAGFTVTHAVDEYEGELCRGNTPPEDREQSLTYDGMSGALFQHGKRALDVARAAGVFTVGWFAAIR